MQQVRGAVIDFSSSPTARHLVLRGPVGSGKSTLARAIALLKRVAPLNPVEAQRILDDCRFDASIPGQVDVRSILSWYVELGLTGLVDTLAEAQLFGVAKGAFTGAVPRAGVFELAQTGRNSDKPHVGARLTGGVVFLDEIGDLSEAMQAKLLPVLSGGAFYRVGSEGDDELKFSGVTICASWRDLDDVLRPDLLSRVADYVIDVPSMAERMDDFDAIFDEVETSQLRSLRFRIEEALRVEPELARDYWRGRLEKIEGLPAAAKKAFRAVPWARHGNLRGLTAALERVHGAGCDPIEVLARLPVIEDTLGGSAGSSASFVERLLQRRADGTGLVEHVRALEHDDRQHLRTRLSSDGELRRRLSAALGIDESRLSTQVRDLGRRRVRSAREAS